MMKNNVNLLKSVNKKQKYNFKFKINNTFTQFEHSSEFPFNYCDEKSDQKRK